MAEPAKPARKTGLAHFFAAAGYSAAGIRRLWRESAFRQEMLGLVAVPVLLWALEATLLHYLVFAGLALLVVALEALNTALECLVDHLTTDWAEFARDAKDLGSLAVLCGLLCHGLLIAHAALA
ncbi:diacylglycerol kinase [Tabrizicola oligotrophica]|uniref:Diacylglycerol kinase n=1 Tax=Tabrizicola oligotrophica TaxID=2710650 RepID=A0A6M0QQ81_9RHOB|nr:diacylglycerol kinase [Tabrizicola oligotrophica]NEY88803.1 diacylglycerol kinase [Tabrizicola oligotrophica]